MTTPWRLHLLNQAIQQLDLLTGDPALVAVWVRRNRVVYLELETGTQIDDQTLTPPDVNDRQSADWLTFITTLQAPNDAYLPQVRLSGLTIYTTDDGRMRLYHPGGNDLLLDTGGREVALDAGDADEFIAVALDRFLGLVAVLDEQCKQHIFQQHISVGAFDLDLKTPDDLDVRPQVAISRGGGSIFLTDGRQLVLADSGGRLNRRVELPYYVRLLACSPDGTYVVTCDMDIGLLRVYSGVDLVPTHQRFAIDLVAQATQVQLIADLPPPSVAPGTLVINDAGVMAFSMAGVVCVSTLSQMDELPRPRALL
jgi:hypothetical protein